MIAAERQRFLDDYLRIRLAEGRGSYDPAYYRALPHEPIRARTYRYFERHILPEMERETQAPLKLLDLGAGTGWMSYRLTLRGHRPIAVDILIDDRDGLGGARHFDRPLACLDAEFDRLPLPDGRFDAVLYNASLHYSSDYFKTLTEARRCVRPGGRIVIMDSPVYRLREHGEMMRRERHDQFFARYGTRSDHISSIEYLDLPAIAALGREIGVEWRFHKPWYGVNWHLRPLRARFRGARPPSRFWILEGKVIDR